MAPDRGGTGDLAVARALQLDGHELEPGPAKAAACSVVRHPRQRAYEGSVWQLEFESHRAAGSQLLGFGTEDGHAARTDVLTEEHPGPVVRRAYGGDERNTRRVAAIA